MKTKLTNIALIAFLLINSVNVMAGEVKSRNQLKLNDSATAVLYTKSITATEALKEIEMELENWMTSFKSFFNAFENEMVLESWMLKEFNSAEGSLNQSLQLEPWMLQPFMANSEFGFQEEEMTLEPWMLKF
jgi:hypothetical protein